ncbi:MAG: hypothetical protein JWM82_1738 [Myxococcales bacterium]|nr:hypothetical protein [Myxococcales bacterium]
MPIPKKLKDEYVKHLDELLQDGQELTKTKHADPEYTTLDGLPIMIVDPERLYEWRTKLGGLLGNMIPANHSQQVVVAEIVGTSSNLQEVIKAVALLRGLRDGFTRGYFDNLHAKIEAELAADYLGQAEQLLGEGQPGKYDHVPAAVLAGAVLEKNLRTLCGGQSPPIPVDKADGTHKMLNLLTDDLKKAGVFNEIQAKQLRAYAAIRNAAAHGEFTEFTRAQVETMVAGITQFLAAQ